MEKVSGKEGREEDHQISKSKPKKEDRVAPSCCTKESINYTIECIPCRLEGKRRMYWGESSRSGHQKGQEHHREIMGGVQTHPLVLHFVEEHSGEKQKYLMRITKYNKKALER